MKYSRPRAPWPSPTIAAPARTSRRDRLPAEPDPSEAFGDFADLEPWSAAPEAAPVAAPQRAVGVDEARDEIRRIVLEELRELVKR